MAVPLFAHLLRLSVIFLGILTARGQYTVSTCQQLNGAIQEANDGGVSVEIRVTSSIDVSKCKGTTEISNSVSIVGMGSPPPTISGRKSVGLFSVSYGLINLSFKNLILSNGKAEYGGCVNIAHSTTSVSFSGVQFQGCSGTSGGGLFLSGGPAVLDSVQFVSNVAQSGGAIYNQGSDNDLIIKSCIFTQNIAKSSSSSASGGAIYSTSKLNISQSSFAHNRGSSLTGGVYGGAINCEKSVTISGSIFFNNSASSRDSEVVGGALLVSSSELFTIINSTFERNSIVALKGNGIGGAISCGFLVVRDSQFNFNSNNALNPSGGAMYSNQETDISSSSFSFNTINSVGRQGSGGAFHLGMYGGPCKISQSNFSSNSISASGKNPTSENNLYGGAIYSYSELFLERNLFTLNSIKYTSTKFAVIAKGGAVYCNSDLSMSFSSLLSNTVHSAASIAVGGAVYAESKLNILSSSFIGNNATSDCKLKCDIQIWGGGGIFVNQESTIIMSSFTDNVFLSNSPKFMASGGAVFFANGYGLSMTARACTFLNNRVLAPFGNASGGAIGASSYYQIFSNSSKFTQNAAIGKISSGGAIYCGQSSLYCSNSTFSRNSADASSGNAYGGAIDLSSYQSNTIVFSEFEGNSVICRAKGSADGGAIFHGYLSYANGNPLKLGYSKFVGNSVTGSVLGRGGTLFVKSEHSVLFSRNYFVGSTAIGNKAYGGVIFAGADAQLSFCAQNYFASNNTVKSGDVTVMDNIYTASSAAVSFCPSITVPVDSSSTFKPSIRCQNCVCEKPFNPCDPIATCQEIDATVYCTCPREAPGSGFICGRVDTCSSTF